MAAKQSHPLSYEMLLGMIPVVMDFLDLDSQDVIASGILDDDRLDDAAIALILSHDKSRNKVELMSSSSNSTTIDRSSDTLNLGVRSSNQEPAETSHSKTPVSTCQLDGFKSQFRMTQAMFEALLHDVMTLTSFATRTDGEGTPSHQEVTDQLPMAPTSMLKLTLHFLGSQQPISQLAASANISEALCSQVVHETMEALYELLQFYILWPDGEQVVDTRDKFREKSGLQGLLGIIDALHIQVKAPEEHTNYYTNQQKETTVVLQTVCDHQLRFLHCCTGWPGSMGEETVLKDSDLHNDVQDQINTYFPFNTYLIGDEAYPLTPWLVTPFPETTNLTSAKEQFNSACRLILQDNVLVYTLLMRRFPRLECVEMKDMQTMVVTILVCCALHNFCLDKGDLMLFEDAEVTIRNINTIAKSSGTRAETESEGQEGEKKRNDVLEQLQKI